MAFEVELDVPVSKDSDCKEFSYNTVNGALKNYRPINSSTLNYYNSNITIYPQNSCPKWDIVPSIFVHLDKQNYDTRQLLQYRLTNLDSLLLSLNDLKLEKISSSNMKFEDDSEDCDIMNMYTPKHVRPDENEYSSKLSYYNQKPDGQQASNKNILRERRNNYAVSGDHCKNKVVDEKIANSQVDVIGAPPGFEFHYSQTSEERVSKSQVAYVGESYRQAAKIRELLWDSCSHQTNNLAPRCKSKIQSEEKIVTEYKPKVNASPNPENVLEARLNLVAMIKDAGEQGIRVDRIISEYCKRYNALLDPATLGYNNVQELINSASPSIFIDFTGSDSDYADSNKFKDNKPIHSPIQQENIYNSIISNDPCAITNSKLCSENCRPRAHNFRNVVNTNSHFSKINGSVDPIRQIDKELQRNGNENCKIFLFSEENQMVKYKCPLIPPDIRFFKNLLVSLVADYTYFNSSPLENGLASRNGMSLEKVPQEWRKKYGNFYDLKTFQTFHGIKKLQEFLEQMDELNVVTNATDVKVYLSPRIQVPKIPQCLSSLMSSSVFSDEMHALSIHTNSSSNQHIPPPPCCPPPPHNHTEHGYVGLSPCNLVFSPNSNKSICQGFSPFRRLGAYSPSCITFANVTPPPPPPLLGHSSSWDPFSKSISNNPASTVLDDQQPKFSLNRLEIEKLNSENHSANVAQTSTDHKSKINTSLSSKIDATNTLSNEYNATISKTFDATTGIQQQCNGLLNAPPMTRIQLHKMLFELVVAGCESQKARWLRGEDLIEMEEENEIRLQYESSLSKCRGKSEKLSINTEKNEDSDSVAPDSDSECDSEDDSSSRIDKRRRKKREKKEKKRRKKAKLRELERYAIAYELSDISPNAPSIENVDPSQQAMPDFDVSTRSYTSSFSCKNNEYQITPRNIDDIETREIDNSSPKRRTEKSREIDDIFKGIDEIDQKIVDESVPKTYDNNSQKSLDGIATKSNEGNIRILVSTGPDKRILRYSELRRQMYRTSAVGMLVSSIKTEWTKRYGEQYPLTLYMSWFGMKKMKFLLLEVPNLIITGSGGFMRVTTVNHAKQFCNPYPPQGISVDGKNSMYLTFTSTSSLKCFQTECYKNLSTSPCSYGKSEKQYENNLKYVENCKSSNQEYTPIKSKSQTTLCLPLVKRNKNPHKICEAPEESFCNNPTLKLHLCRLMYSLIAKVCQEQHAIHLLAMMQSDQENDKETSTAVFCETLRKYDLPSEQNRINFTNSTLLSESEYMAKDLAKHGVYGLKFSDIISEWYDMYNCHLTQLMKKAGFVKLNDLVESVRNVQIIKEGDDARCVIALPQSRATLIDSPSEVMPTHLAEEPTPICNMTSFDDQVQSNDKSKPNIAVPRHSNKGWESNMAILQALINLKQATLSQLDAVNTLKSAFLSYAVINEDSSPLDNVAESKANLKPNSHLQPKSKLPHSPLPLSPIVRSSNEYPPLKRLINTPIDMVSLQKHLSASVNSKGINGRNVRIEDVLPTLCCFNSYIPMTAASSAVNLGDSSNNSTANSGSIASPISCEQLSTPIGMIPTKSTNYIWSKLHDIDILKPNKEAKEFNPLLHPDSLCSVSTMVTVDGNCKSVEPTHSECAAEELQYLREVLSRYLATGGDFRNFIMNAGQSN